MFIDWTTSKANAESMYNNNYVSSGLITGTQWDVILNTIVDKTDLTTADMTSSGSWGNYKTNSVPYIGKKVSASYSSNKWYLPAFPTGDTLTSGNTTAYASNVNAGDLYTTGASSQTEKYHLFDIAGNLWEWTEEDSHYATSGQYRVLRGGSCANAPGDYPACYRNGLNTVSYTDFGLGFRAVLYIK